PRDRRRRRSEPVRTRPKARGGHGASRSVVTDLGSARQAWSKPPVPAELGDVGCSVACSLKEQRVGGLDRSSREDRVVEEPQVPNEAEPVVAATEREELRIRGAVVLGGERREEDV